MSTDRVAILAKPTPATPLNRKRVEALVKSIHTVVRTYRYTAPRGNGGVSIGEELNAMALGVAGVIRQAPGTALALRACFASSLIKIMEALGETGAKPRAGT